MTRVTTSCTDCGWTTSTDTAARADYAYRQHSCAKQRRQQAATLRRVRRRSEIDRTPQVCHHKQTTHQHGTHACYVLDNCRCRPCANATRDYEATRRRHRAYGRQAYVDAEPARQHVRALGQQGMGWKRVAAAADLDTSVIWKLLYGDRTRRSEPSKRIRPATEAAILAVHLDLAGGARVDPTGTARRLQALVVTGWSINQISTRTGVDRQALDAALNGRPIVARTANAVRTGYDQLWNAPAPETNQRERIAAARSRRRGAERGWAPPLAWDDDTIDDPTAKPATAEPSATPRSVDLDDVAWLASDGLTAPLIASRLHVTVSALEQACRRAARADLWHHININDRTAA